MNSTTPVTLLLAVVVGFLALFWYQNQTDRAAARTAIIQHDLKIAQEEMQRALIWFENTTGPKR